MFTTLCSHSITFMFTTLHFTPPPESIVMHEQSVVFWAFFRTLYILLCFTKVFSSKDQKCCVEDTQRLKGCMYLKIKSQRCQTMFQRWQYWVLWLYNIKTFAVTFHIFRNCFWHFLSLLLWTNLNSCHLILRCCGQQNLIFCWHDTEGGFYPQWYFTNSKKETHSLIF